MSVRPGGLLAAVGVLLCAATIFGFLGPLAWFFDVFSHFHVQYFAGLGLLAIVLATARKWKTSLCYALLAVLNLSVVLPVYFGRSVEVPAGTQTLRAVLVNVNTRFGDVKRIRDLLRQTDADFIVLEEIDTRWVDELEPVTADYAHFQVQPRIDNFGIALYSKLPFKNADIFYIGDTGIPSIYAEVETPHGPLTIIATHPLPPAGAEYSRWRNEQLEKLPDYVRKTPSPVLLLGDLNVTPWNHYFRRLLKESGLRNSSQGRGVQATWPVNIPPLRIPIDHCLHSPELRIVDKQIGPNVGSDHYPVVVDFALPSTAAPPEGGTTNP